MSTISGWFLTFGGMSLDVKEDGGRAASWGVKLPLVTLGSSFSKPSTALNNSSAVFLASCERGKLSFATSVARVTKVERGRVMPSVACTRFWTSRTEDRDIDTATSVSGTGSFVGVADSDGAEIGVDAVASFGGATFMLLRSR